MTLTETESNLQPWTPAYAEPLTDEQATSVYNDKRVLAIRAEVMKEALESKHIDSWFLQEHLLEVERLAASLFSLYPEADQNMVGLAVWFHDVARLSGHDEDHALMGAKRAKAVMEELGFNNDEISLVFEACLRHGCKGKLLPLSLEAKILATADALSHFFHDFYTNAAKHYREKKNLPEEEVAQTIQNKIDRDFHNKIFFDEAKEYIRPVYEELKEQFV